MHAPTFFCRDVFSFSPHVFPLSFVIYTEEVEGSMDIEEQYDRLLRYCIMKLGDRALAEDVTQSAFIRYFENPPSAVSGNDMAYLYTIARNLCTDWYRKRKDALLEDLPEEQREAARDAASQDVTDRLAVETALARLCEEERELVVLRYVSELTVTEIGKATGLSRFAVRRRLSGALNKLRKELDDYEEG